MVINCIFEMVKESLYSVHFDNEESNEFVRLMELWTDAEYLEEFFESHKSDLESGFWGDITVEEAILKTREEAIRFEEELLELAETGKTNRFETLSTLFKPIHDTTTSIKEFEENKAKGDNKPSWLRIYAIRIDINLFVISGGAIKLTKTMNETEYLLLELQKLELTKKYLLDEDNADLEFFQLFL